jgi:hypothetical protein
MINDQGGGANLVTAWSHHEHVQEENGTDNFYVGDGPYLLWAGGWDNLQLSEKTVQQVDGGGGGHSFGTYYIQKAKKLEG